MSLFNRKSYRKKFKRGSAMTEYVIILTVICSCSIAMYFSTLVTGIESAGRQVCGDCPETFDPNDDPWSKWTDKEREQKARDKLKEKQNKEEVDETVDDPDQADDGMSELQREEAKIIDQYWGYMIDNWFDWLWV